MRGMSRIATALERHRQRAEAQLAVLWARNHQLPDAPDLAPERPDPELEPPLPAGLQRFADRVGFLPVELDIWATLAAMSYFPELAAQAGELMGRWGGFVPKVGLLALVMEERCAPSEVVEALVSDVLRDFVLESWLRRAEAPDGVTKEARGLAKRAAAGELSLRVLSELSRLQFEQGREGRTVDLVGPVSAELVQRLRQAHAGEQVDLCKRIGSLVSARPQLAADVVDIVFGRRAPDHLENEFKIRHIHVYRLLPRMVLDACAHATDSVTGSLLFAALVRLAEYEQTLSDWDRGMYGGGATASLENLVQPRQRLVDFRQIATDHVCRVFSSMALPAEAVLDAIVKPLLSIEFDKHQLSGVTLTVTNYLPNPAHAFHAVRHAVLDALWSSLNPRSAVAVRRGSIRYLAHGVGQIRTRRAPLPDDPWTAELVVCLERARAFLKSGAATDREWVLARDFWWMHLRQEPDERLRKLADAMEAEFGSHPAIQPWMGLMLSRRSAERSAAHKRLVECLSELELPGQMAALAGPLEQFEPGLASARVRHLAYELGREHSANEAFFDMALLGTDRGGALPVEAYRSAVDACFTERGTHGSPVRLPEPPADWTVGLEAILREDRLPWDRRERLMGAVRAFVDPILGSGEGRWSPGDWSWQ